ncbi:MAG: hypothetical protein KKH66_10900 [Proteobacteria bacterium]|nr:hypothetical protein [Pseudomonadota bacterium]MBU4605403.1 hypothetical protein [Pseudomonadota bacterium]MCG2763308.1 hypothetical protein [Desulfarculaceae bacterium]
MDQRIFEQGLSVEATSLYLLLSSLSDSGVPLILERVEPIWNAEPETLGASFEELAGRAIAFQDESGAWHLNPASQWRSA